VFNGTDVVWAGELNRPESGGEETITLQDMGSMTFYFGTDDQTANSVIGSKLEDPTLNVPYRHLCWAFFNDCCIGKYTRMPTMKFVVGKFPSFAFSSDNKIQLYDYNPAHALYYIFSEMLGLPTNYFHSGDFSTVASTLKDENRGVSILFAQQTVALSYIESVLSHVDGIIRYGVDGKFHPKLLRADEAVEDLPSIDETDILDKPSMERRAWFDTLNEIRVQHTERLQIGCTCKGISIGYETLEMTFAEVQTLTVEGIQAGCEYFWTIKSGGGSLSEDSGESVQYTAPDACDVVVIDLSISGEVCDIISISVIGCSEAVINYTTLQMSCDEVQTLSVENPIAGCTYSWEIVSGGGELSSDTGFSVMYTAPSSNAGCANNPIIQLSCGDICDSITIAVNQWTGNEAAYSIARPCQIDENGTNCDYSPGTCVAWCQGTYWWCSCVPRYGCDGDYLAGTESCCRGVGESGCITQCAPGSITDKRTQAMIDGGCCPGDLL